MTRWSLGVLLVSGCLPKRLTLEVPEWTADAALPAAGPTVAIAWPVDARPPSERTELGRYYAVNLPLVTYGEANLNPGTLEIIDRSLAAALPATGVATAPWDEADYRVRVFVLRHAGRRDISDSNWVGTATGGIAGTVGKFITPQFTAVEGHLRLEIRRRDDTLVAIRDVAAFRVEKRALALTWQYWSLFFRSPTAEMFARAIAGVDSDLSRDAAMVIDEARHEAPVTTGIAPERSVYASLGRFERVDTFSFGEPATELWRAKYGADRFSVASGWTAEAGEVVGRIGIPRNNVGYDIGLGEGVQLLLDLTVFGRLNSAGVGGRVRLARSERWAFGLEGRASADGELFDEAPKGELIGPWDPHFVGTTGSGSTLLSFREGRFAPYLRLTGTGGLHEGLPIAGLGGAQGLEVQLGPTLAIAAEFVATRWWDADRPPIEYAPQVTLGLR